MISLRIVVATLSLFAAFQTAANSDEHDAPPTIRTYKTIGTTDLKAHIFMPADPANGKLRAAIILLHGGGWNIGDPEWTYGDAKRYAGLGLVAISGEYRLSDQKNITPLEAMADARDLIRWVRQHSAELAVDPQRIAVSGISAGGQLASAAAIFPHQEENKVSAVPNALILLSPAVSIVNDHWPQMLLGGRAEVKDISPAENIKGRMPPIIIIEGAADTVTPLSGAKRFCERAKEFGGTCELNVYGGLGHLLTLNLDPQAQEQGPFDTDPAALADAHAKEDMFLVRIGYAKRSN